MVCLFVLIGAICAEAAALSSLDGAARDYVRLTLAIGAHEKDYVDAYFGQPAWKTEAEPRPRTILELKAEAVASAPS